MFSWILTGCSKPASPPAVATASPAAAEPTSEDKAAQPMVSGVPTDFSAADQQAITDGLAATRPAILACYSTTAGQSVAGGRKERVQVAFAPGGIVSKVTFMNAMPEPDAGCITGVLTAHTFSLGNTDVVTVSMPLPSR
ncbi:MAG: hypothetical protein IPL79_15140 [Myxococcales bacterium]|nr:hypothetical protein [Myxococcales bacterium]